MNSLIPPSQRGGGHSRHEPSVYIHKRASEICKTVRACYTNVRLFWGVWYCIAEARTALVNLGGSLWVSKDVCRLGCPYLSQPHFGIRRGRSYAGAFYIQIIYIHTHIHIHIHRYNTCLFSYMCLQQGGLQTVFLH